jgi:peroxiredoxin/mono/diheme cytochrome c family protein
MLALMTLALAAAPDAKPAVPQPGAAVANVKLNDQHRRPRTLGGFKEKKALVVVFVGTECPLANQFLPTLAELHKEYAGKGVQFLAINANPQDAFVAVAAHAIERNIPFPVLKDFDGKAAAAFGATRTPEAFVLDSERIIRYHGRIDDQYGIGVRRDEPKRRDLKLALDELLADKPVSVPTTEVEGCVIGKPREAAVKGEVTYAKHVAPILQQRCQECHRPGQVGPFSLLSYDKAVSWSDTIAEVVREERMPPWYADPKHGKFLGDRRLTAAERDTLLAWVKQGCPKGDEKDLPAAARFPETWTIGKPDQVVSMAEEFKVPAKGVLPYKQFVVDPGFKEEKWVQRAECRPGNRAVVHHIIVYILQPGKLLLYDKDGVASTLVGWAPGDMPARYEPGTAKRVPAGARLMFEVHYTPNGKEEVDRSSIGLIFAEKPPEHVVETNILANMKLRVPPQNGLYREDFVYTFKEDAQLISFMPHMHLRGVAARYTATYPDGRTETLLNVPDWDFNWQTAYRFAKPIAMPKGTKITWSGWWDNSPDNPRNPDPTKEVRWGLQTWDEMHNGWMEVVRKRK